jgi:tRNA-dihydrouridine synthase B
LIRFLPPRIGLAPLSGFNDPAFIVLCFEYGAQWAITGLISAEGLVRGDHNSLRLLSEPAGHPLFAQIFGAEAKSMAAAACLAEQAGYDGIDINAGCPTYSVIRTRGGADLMRDLPRASAVVDAVRRTVKFPVTLKMRLGWEAQKTYLQLGRLAEQAGVDAIILHPRTANQGYGGNADWTALHQLKRHLNIPVVASGDVTDSASYHQILHDTGCDGILIGRGAIGRPWVFRQCLEEDESGRRLSIKTVDRKQAMLRYMTLLQAVPNRWTAYSNRHIQAFVRGMPNATRFRGEAAGLRDWETATTLIQSYFERMEERE